MDKAFPKQFIVLQLKTSFDIQILVEYILKRALSYNQKLQIVGQSQLYNSKSYENNKICVLPMIRPKSLNDVLTQILGIDSTTSSVNVVNFYCSLVNGKNLFLIHSLME
jgi:hypothetical protein